MHLADQLEVPLRDRNALLLAAGYAPAYGQRDLEAAEMRPVREAIDRLRTEWIQRLGHDRVRALEADLEVMTTDGP